MSETHYDYFLKDLKRTCLELLQHQKNRPIILINETKYINNISQLFEILIEDFGLKNSALISDFELTNFEENL